MHDAPRQTPPSAPAPFRCGGALDRLIRRILVEAAPVYAGAKPATMLNLRTCERAGGGRAHRSFCRHRDALAAALGLSILPLRKTAEGTLLLFYDPPALARCLAAPDAAAFLRRRGYPAEPAAALRRLAASFAEGAPGRCPHEVGLFLGYPVRDVEGFIERPREALPLRRALWSVFAPAADSLRLMARIRTARERALGLLALESDALRACAMLRRAPAV